MKIYRPNHREYVETIGGYVNSPDVITYILDEKAAFDYEVLDVTTRVSTGSCTGGFYIQDAGTTAGDGTSIVGLDPISISTTQTTSTATSANTVRTGQRLKFSIPTNSSSGDLAFTVRTKRV